MIDLIYFEPLVMGLIFVSILISKLEEVAFEMHEKLKTLFERPNRGARFLPLELPVGMCDQILWVRLRGC